VIVNRARRRRERKRQNNGQIAEKLAELTYKELKGLFVLAALANGVPVFQPRHWSFPELIEATGGGQVARRDGQTL
jgi:hypothetical protein